MSGGVFRLTSTVHLLRALAAPPPRTLSAFGSSIGDAVRVMRPAPPIIEPALLPAPRTALRTASPRAAAALHSHGHSGALKPVEQRPPPARAGAEAPSVAPTVHARAIKGLAKV